MQFLKYQGAYSNIFASEMPYFNVSQEKCETPLDPRAAPVELGEAPVEPGAFPMEPGATPVIQRLQGPCLTPVDLVRLQTRFAGLFTF